MRRRLVISEMAQQQWLRDDELRHFMIALQRRCGWTINMYFKNKECCSTLIHTGLMTIMQYNVHSEYVQQS